MHPVSNNAETLVTSLLRQCSLYYVLIKFLLRPHSTTSSLRFFEHVRKHGDVPTTIKCK